MASKVRYNANTGKWESMGDSGSEVESNVSDSTSPNQNTINNKDSAQSKAEEEYNEIDYYNLQGSLSYIATPSTIKIKAGDTITIKGVGKYLSGNYYVVSVNRKLDSSGYSHTAEVVRMNFGSSKVSTTPTQPKPKEVPQAPITRTYTVVKGDSLWSIAKKMYGNGAKYTTIFEANKDKIKNPSLIYVGQVLTIP